MRCDTWATFIMKQFAGLLPFRELPLAAPPLLRGQAAPILSQLGFMVACPTCSQAVDTACCNLVAEF